MHSDKQNLFLTTFKKWVLAKKSGQIPHSALDRNTLYGLDMEFLNKAFSDVRVESTAIRTQTPRLDGRSCL